MKKAVAYLAILLAVLLLSLFLSPKNNPPETDNKKIKREKIAEVKEPETEWVEQTEAVTPTSPQPLPFPVAEAETPPNPLPVEWEEPFFDILDNSKSREDRNSRLYLFASTTAQTAPRVKRNVSHTFLLELRSLKRNWHYKFLKIKESQKAPKYLCSRTFKGLGRMNLFIIYLLNCPQSYRSRS